MSFRYANHINFSLCFIYKRFEKMMVTKYTSYILMNNFKSSAIAEV